ncbi:MAG TPA: phospho-sugar mutase [Gemmataceae bacterium]|nr:phospho-sugar mutase [Gemmataceae bacterium]
MSHLDQAAGGFATISNDKPVIDRALQFLHQWLSDPQFVPYRPQLEWLIGQQHWSVLLDSFYQILPFGTGGRRGSVGIGPNRMNLWTLGASVQGHCDYLRQRFPDVEPLRVVLGYDVRRFLDARKIYNPDLPNPVLGLSSKDLTHHAAGVYAANGVHVLTLPADSARYMSTPEVSFAIRYLSAHGGLTLTASHNPPDDNGLKFSDERGAQPVAPEDQIMTDIADQVTAIKLVPFGEAVRSGKIHFLDDTVHRAYVELCLKQSLIPPPRFDEFTLVFTPLHGVGGMSAGEVLAEQGFRPVPVPEQATPDGQFPNVTKSPNPEVPESLDRAERVAKEVNADLVLATDPDADRLGALAADSRGGFRYITGNEICALVTWFKLDQLKRKGRMPQSPLVVTTVVTTSLVTRIARHFGAQVVNNLLVGFKHMAEVLRQLEETGSFEDVRARPEDMVIATEESHGILAMPQIRDKDAAAGCLLFAELALDQKRHGKTLVDLLEHLARQFGYFRNELITIVMPGLQGKQNMARMLERLRAEPPMSIAGLPVIGFEDLRDPDGRMGPLKGATDAAGRNVLVFRLGEGVRVVLRPSGTEPKAKAYIEVASAPRSAGQSDDAWQNVCRGIDEQTRRLADEFLALAMSLAGLEPSAGHVPLSR